MGLGFSLMVDPQNGQQTPVLSQFYLLMMILVYLALNGHLVLIEVLVDSFRTLPVGGDGVSANSFHTVAKWGSNIFSGGLAMALPAIASLLVVNLAFGIMTRAAPQLNLFAIGFPVTMMLGFMVVWIAMGSIIPQTNNLFTDVFHLLRQLSQGGPQ
jgi:flagellar biosynthetic protein FliR